MKASTDYFMLVVFGLLIGLVMFSTYVIHMTKQGDVNIQELTDKHASTINNIFLTIDTVEQGVRIYKLSNSYDIALNETHIKLTFVGETRTVADDSEELSISVVRHNLDDVIPNEIPAAGRICISKRIVDCTPFITICSEGEPCCDIQPSNCKYVI